MSAAAVVSDASEAEGAHTDAHLASSALVALHATLRWLGHEGAAAARRLQTIAREASFGECSYSVAALLRELESARGERDEEPARLLVDAAHVPAMHAWGVAIDAATTMVAASKRDARVLRETLPMGGGGAEAARFGADALLVDATCAQDEAAELAARVSDCEDALVGARSARDAASTAAAAARYALGVGEVVGGGDSAADRAELATLALSLGAAEANRAACDELARISAATEARVREIRVVGASKVAAALDSLRGEEAHRARAAHTARIEALEGERRAVSDALLVRSQRIDAVRAASRFTTLAFARRAATRDARVAAAAALAAAEEAAEAAGGGEQRPRVVAAAEAAVAAAEAAARSERELQRALLSRLLMASAWSIAGEAVLRGQLRRLLLRARHVLEAAATPNTSLTRRHGSAAAVSKRVMIIHRPEWDST